MIKKWSKYLLTTICVFFVSLIVTSAKEVTIEELTELVKEYNPQANSVFVIGEYAFTSGHELTLQDIMLAARSIEVPDGSGDKNTDPIYGKMVIDAFNGTLGDDWTLQSLTYAGNLIGPSNEKETYNIRYVDYNRIYEEIDLVSMAKDAYSKYESSIPSAIDTKLDSTGTKLAVTIKDFNLDLSAYPVDSIKDQAKALADEIFATAGIESITITYKTTEGKTVEKTITSEDVNAIYEMDNATLKTLVKSYVSENDLTIDSIIGGTATIKVNLKDGYKATSGIDTFEASVAAELDLKGMADKAYSKYETSYADKLASYVDVEYKDAKASINLKTAMVDLDAIPTDKIKGLAKTLLDKASSVPGVKSVTITLTTADGSVITKDVTLDEVIALSEMNTDELKTLVKDYINENNLTIDSVIGGEVVAKVNLKTGYTAKDGVDTFTATFAAELNLKGLVNAAYNKYESSYKDKLADYVVAEKLDDTSVEVILKAILVDTSLIPQEKLNQVKDKLSEVKALLDEVTYIPGLQSVTVKLTSAEGEVVTETITEEQLLTLKDMSADELKTLVKAYIENNDITVDSVIGGTVTAKVNLKTGYTAKDDVDTFSATFKAEIDFKGIANAAYNKYEADYASKLEDYVVTKKIDETTLEVTAKVLTTDLSLVEEKVNELKDQYKDEISEVKALLDKVTYIPGLESLTVTLTTSDSKTLTANITEAEALALKDMSLDELKALAKEYISASGLTIDSIIGGEVDVKINLKDGYAAKDGIDTFKALFKVEYDLKGLADKAYNKFNTDYAVFLESVATIEKVKDTDTEYNVVVKTTDEAKLTTIANMLKSQAGDLLGEVSSVPGVDTITVKLTTSDARTFTKNITMAHLDLLNEMSVDEIKVYLKALATKHSLNTSSILGGNLEAKINLKKGYSAKDSIDTFKINLLASAYDVKFDVDGAVTFQSVKVGDKVTKPATPTKEGYTFDKWLLNGEEYDFDSKVNSSITLTASWKLNTYEVTIEANEFGKVSEKTLIVEHGTTVITDGNVLKIGDQEITATPADNTTQYKYSFDKWVGVPATVTSATTIKANFKQEESLYTVSVVADELGTVNKDLIENVAYGTAIETDGNVLKIGDKEITAEPIAKDAQYTYSFDSWTVESNTVTDDVTITANFKKEVNKYTVSFAYNDENFGQVNKTLIEVPYGAEIKIDGNKITIGEETITATPADNTAQYKYSFNKWTNVPESNKIIESTVIYANFNQTEISLYTITFKSNDSSLGNVDGTSLTDLQEGTEIQVDGNKITIGLVTITATAKTADAENTYSFTGWSVANGTKITDDLEITANFAKITNNYTVTLNVNNVNYGTLSESVVTVPYGSIITVDENVITIGEKEITAIPATKTDAKYYTFEDLSSTSAIMGDTAVTVNFKEWTIVDVAGNVSSAVNASYGTNNLGESHSMDFLESANNTITLKYSGTKSSKWLLLYTLNGTAVESFDIIQFMEKLVDGHGDIYDSVIWDYNGWTTKNDDTGKYEYLDISKLDYDNMGMFGFNAQNWSCTIFSRFMSKLSGLSGGSNFANIDLDTMIANTTATPIKMKIKLADGYITADGKTEVEYNVVFAK